MAAETEPPPAGDVRPWACPQFGQPAHDWFACPACLAAYERYLEEPEVAEVPEPAADPMMPRRWKRKNEFGDFYYYGCYFPSSGVNATDGGSFVTGVLPNVEWLDDPPPA